VNKSKEFYMFDDDRDEERKETKAYTESIKESTGSKSAVKKIKTVQPVLR
jgi:hypothetical protein